MALEAADAGLTNGVTPETPTRAVPAFVLAERKSVKSAVALGVAEFDAGVLEDDGRLATARGISIAVVIAVPLWMAFGVGVYLLI